VRRAQRFEYIDNMGHQEIWRHTFDADLGEHASITFGKAAATSVAVVPYGEAAPLVETLNRLTEGLTFGFEKTT